MMRLNSSSTQQTFVIGGPRETCGLTGYRKIIVDTFMAVIHVTVVVPSVRMRRSGNRSASRSRLHCQEYRSGRSSAKKAEVQLAYAIGVVFNLLVRPIPCTEILLESKLEAAASNP